jgi:uncharacterized protein (TIGR02444 family)
MTDRLWAWSLAFYARPGVADACLHCQDAAGADVNVILFLLWQGSDGVCLTPAEIGAADAAVDPWRAQVVQPLRAVHRYLKAAAPDGPLRAAVKAAELAAERDAQGILATHARPPTGAPQADAAARNLDAYGAATGCCLPPGATATLLAAYANHAAAVLGREPINRE